MPKTETNSDDEKIKMPQFETNFAKETPFVEKGYPTWIPLSELNGANSRRIRVHQALFILKSTNFLWRQSPIKTLQDKLRICGLDLTVFGEDPILFCTLKQRLFRKFRGSLRKYKPLLYLVNQKHWPWQVEMIWEILFNNSLHEDNYVKLEILINSS